MGHGNHVDLPNSCMSRADGSGTVVHDQVQRNGHCKVRKLAFGQTIGWQKNGPASSCYDHGSMARTAAADCAAKAVKANAAEATAAGPFAVFEKRRSAS